MTPLQREREREREERGHGQVYTTFRVRLYSFGPALFTLEQFTFSWFGVRKAYSFTKKERERERERKREGESRAQGMGKLILRLECVYMCFYSFGPALFTLE